MALGIVGLALALVLARGYARAFLHGDSRLVRLAAPVGALVLAAAVAASAVSALVLPLFPLVVLAPAPVAEVCRRVSGGRPFAALLVYVVGGVLVLYGALIALLDERTLAGASATRPRAVLVAGLVVALAGAASLWRLSSRAPEAVEARLL